MPAKKQNKRSTTEEFRIAGHEILEKVKEILHEGNVRRIILKGEDGRTFMELPLTVGVVGALIAPVWAAIGAVAALASDLTLVVEKTEDEKPPKA